MLDQANRPLGSDAAVVVYTASPNKIESMHLRREKSDDAAAIEQVTIAAFRDAPHTGHTEQFIVRALRRRGRLSVSLVADDAGMIVGHVAISPVEISGGDDGWFGLGPISVTPSWQRRGVGTSLMREALARLRALGARGCVVLGEPGYYARFGFRAEPSLILPDVPAEYFQALSFDGGMPSGIVAYDEAFAATS